MNPDFAVIPVPPATITPVAGQPYVLADAECIDLFKQVHAVASQITIVNNDSQCEYARAVMNEAGRLVKKIDTARKKAKDPYRKVGEAIDAAAKQWTQPMEKVVAAIKTRLDDYVMRVELARQAALAEQTRREAVAAAEAAAAGTAPRLVLDVDVPAAAAVATRTDYDVVVEDIRLIPEQYLVVDTAAIRRDILAGVGVPGAKLVGRLVTVNR